jgi:signal transduction histidine kinase
MRAMSLPRKTFKILPDTTLRRLRSTPSYFFLLWRWSMWLYALLLIIFTHDPIYTNKIAYRTSIVLLFVTLVQTLIVTLYAFYAQKIVPQVWIFPFFQRLQRRKGQPLQREDEDTELLTPLSYTHNSYWNSAIYSFDVIICGLVTYLSGPFGLAPNFGTSSPFYRYGVSTVFAAALAYRYPGALAAATGYNLFILLGIFLPPPGTHDYTPNVIDIAGSLVDAPIAALLAAFAVTLLTGHIQSKRELQADIRQQRALLQVGETIVREASTKQHLLQKSAEQLCNGGPFQRLVVVLVAGIGGEDDDKSSPLEMETRIEIDTANNLLPRLSDGPLEQVLSTGESLIAFELFDKEQYGIARLYLPFPRSLEKRGQVQMILGAESIREHPFENRQINFLTIAGTQLLIALENICLTEQTIQLAAAAERSRIAREIHDGVAQLVYMLSLNAETCATQAHRIAEASDEDADLLAPLVGRLDKLVTISKQALWETRNYMFSLKPLMSGTTTLTQMLSNQIREFEAISDIRVDLTVDGSEQHYIGDPQRVRKLAKVAAALFRIVQEALTNAYKHAEATEIRVQFRYLPDHIEVEICDNGRGIPALVQSEESRRIYSGHGIQGMYERTRELGGIFAVVQLPDSGVKVHVLIPIL